MDAKVSKEPAVSITVTLILKMGSKLLRNVGANLRDYKLLQLANHSAVSLSEFRSVCNTSVTYFVSNYDKNN